MVILAQRPCISQEREGIKGRILMLPKHQRNYEFRCPVHGFVTLTDWEREIISQPAYQRLRRIRQLGWTDQVYPGAMHTRFEHILGVMHVATAMYDGIVNSSRDLLEEKMNFDEAGLERDRILVRLTALLHDLGHSPFSHAGEELFPFGRTTIIRGTNTRITRPQSFARNFGTRSKITRGTATTRSEPTKLPTF